MASVDGWRRRQPNNSQMLSQQMQPQQSRFQPQYQQPQSRVIRQLHNQYNERPPSQNQIWKALGQPYSDLLAAEALGLTQKLSQFHLPDSYRTRQMSNAELEDMIINRNVQSINVAEDLALLALRKHRFSNGAEKCCCNSAVQSDLAVNKIASLTTINSSVCDSPPPDTLMSKLKQQMMPLVYEENSRKSSWPHDSLVMERDLNAINGYKYNGNVNDKDFSFLPSSSLQRQSFTPQHQRQRNLQTGSFEEHYEFYAESDKASHENTPSVSSIDDLQQTLPVNAGQQYQQEIRRLQTDAFLSMQNENHSGKSNKSNSLSRTVKRPNSLRFVFSFS